MMMIRHRKSGRRGIVEAVEEGDWSTLQRATYVILWDTKGDEKQIRTRELVDNERFEAWEHCDTLGGA
jgi:hypothetical protein